MPRTLSTLAALMLAAVPAAAADITGFFTYDMPNGQTGTYTYWDESYSGSGDTTTDFAPLSGGTGDLTDGIFAADHWNIVEAPAGPGPYVGWFESRPVITFNLPGPLLAVWDQVTIWFDDINGLGGVRMPASVDVQIGGVMLNVPVADPASNLPNSPVVIDLSGFPVSDSLSVAFNRSDFWVFASEVRIEGDIVGDVPVPAPVGLALFGLGLVTLATARRR